MPVAQELPIYKKMYDLLLMIFDARDNFPRGYRYEFGTELMMKAFECCELIQAANSSFEYRQQLLQEFSIKFGTLQLMLRVCRDRHIISVNQFSDMLILVGEIGRQATGWRNSARKPEPPKPR